MPGAAEPFEDFLLTSVATANSWRVNYVEPGTVYVDEPSVPVPPGWWVIGGYGDLVTETGIPVALRVAHAVSPAGEDVTAEVAHAVAEALRAAGSVGPPGYLHSVSRFEEVWSVLRNRPPRARCGEVLAFDDSAAVTSESPPCPYCADRAIR